jgi:tRNA dimethylallyltransferase
VGPTSSGKTHLAIQLAKRFGGEIINADARQVYKDFNIGTGKPAEGKRGIYEKRRVFLVKGVPHYLMDFLPPDETFTVAEWRRKTLKAIRYITDRGHLPIIVGGTGLYVQALLDNYRIPSVAPQPAFREAMEKKTLEELVALLGKMDPKALAIVDLKNRRRVLRAIEVVTYSGKPFSAQRKQSAPTMDALVIAPFREKEDLHARIHAEVEAMVERGWIDEIRHLHDRGIAWDAPAMTSIGYREIARYVRGECKLEEAIEDTKRATRQYAKRQMTWFKRDKRIHWIKDEKEAVALVKGWMGV